ncbi:ABC1-domain-containing protein [Meredithblackwellia eburnea MCA 4105]
MLPLRVAARIRLVPTHPPSPSRLLVKQLRSYSNRGNGSNYSRWNSYTNSSSSNNKSTIIKLIPLFLASSSIRLDNTPPDKGLAAITSQIDHPDAQEFLVAEGKLLEDKPPTFIGRIIYFIRDWVIEPISTSFRFLHLAVLFLPVIFASPILLLEIIESSNDRRKGQDSRDSERATTRWWYRFLVHQMELAGPTFIKLGQWAGSRTDLFPASLCILFGKLHSNGNPHSFRYTKRVIERAFGRKFEEIFLEFKEKPMGIGAIAQVYKAILNPDILPADYLDPKHQNNPSPTAVIGRTIAPTTSDKVPVKVPSTAVAIKVLHPGVEKMIARDLKIMMFFASALNLFPGMEWLSFPEEVQVFGEMMMSQVDLRIEANNLVTFEDKFKHRPTVSFPRALKKYTSPQVLIEEFEDAVPLEAFLSEGGGPFDHRIANLGLDAFLNMLLIDNWVHSDLHPGNIMIKFFKPTTESMLSSMWAGWRDKPEPDAAAAPSNVDGVEVVHRLRAASHDRQAWLDELEKLDLEGYQPEIVFIDAGLVTTLNEKNRRDFLDLFSAVAQFDGHRAGKLMVERCRAPELVIDQETFALRMQHLVLSVKSQTFSLAKIKIADVLSSVLFNVRQHHVKLEADFVNVIVSILLLEGIGRQMDPDMDLFKSAVPILRQLGSQMRPTDIVDSGLDVKSLGAMFTIWVWLEARQLASVAVGEVDDLVRYDSFAPSI